MELTKAELRAAIITERVELIRLVETSSEEDLKKPSLCKGWSNENVLGHIIGFELRPYDAFQLFFRLRPLNDINEAQAKRYAGLSKAKYTKLLRKGMRRTLFVLYLFPDRMFNKKFIRVPHGRISISQLIGDMVADRAVHYLDIAQPLGIASSIDEKLVMRASLEFFLSCADLLNAKVPEKYYGQIVKLQLTGLCGHTYYWHIGTDKIESSLSKKDTDKIVLIAVGDTNDLLFTAAERPKLIKHPIKITGDKKLATTLRKMIKPNATWES